MDKMFWQKRRIRKSEETFSVFLLLVNWSVLEWELEVRLAIEMEIGSVW